MICRLTLQTSGESTWNDTFNRSKMPHKFAWRLLYSAVYETMLLATASKVFLFAFLLRHSELG